MDLLGMAEDRTLYLWEANAKVLPLSRFPMDGKRIVSGHYVIDVRGHAVTVCCNNAAEPGFIVVQFMCSGGRQKVWTRHFIEADLLGQVVKDPEAEAEIQAMLRELTAAAMARQQAPHRKRGRA